MLTRNAQRILTVLVFNHECYNHNGGFPFRLLPFRLLPFRLLPFRLLPFRLLPFFDNLVVFHVKV